MVAVIKIGSSIRRTFHYNENKVKEGHAVLLSAENYPIKATNLTENLRLQMLLKTAETNPEVKSNSVHISLNFAPGEQLNDTLLKQISREYMDQIGFGDQPYLLYRHDDAGHPHVHIATVKVRVDGTRIETQNIGKQLSEPARKALEAKYGLVKAEEYQRQLFSLKPVDVQRVQYGKIDTRRAIASVLGKVIGGYRYTTINELNAVLRQYNIEAYRGQEGSRTHKTKGLLYRLIDSNGKPVGVPLKASLFHNKPTLKSLEKRFLKNDLERQEHKQKLKSKVLYALGKGPISQDLLTERLRREGVHVAFHYSKDNLLYGITYVDHRARCVFNGSSLGKECAAAAVRERLLAEPKLTINPGLNERKVQGNAIPAGGKTPEGRTVLTASANTTSSPTAEIFNQLMQPEYASQAVPYEWRKKKKKKRKRL